MDYIPDAETRDRTGDLQIFSLTLSQLSYRGSCTQLCLPELPNDWQVEAGLAWIRQTLATPAVPQDALPA